MSNLDAPTAEQAILAAAIQLFSTREFDAVSLRDVTAACGAKRSLILYHYGSKDELWRRAMRAIVDRFNEAMFDQQPVDRQGPLANQLTAIALVYLEALAKVPEYAQVLLREGVRPGERLDWIVDHFVPEFGLGDLLAADGIGQRLHSGLLREVFIGLTLTSSALRPLIETANARDRHRDVPIPLDANGQRLALAKLMTGLLLDTKA